MPAIPNLLNLVTDESWVIVFLWFFGHMIFSVLPIGQLVEGREVANGKRLKYRCNGRQGCELHRIAFG